MILLKLLVLVTGIILTIFGILIYFCKKYSFINYYEKKKNLKGFKTNAKAIGLIEFINGIVFTIFAIMALIFIPDKITLYSFFGLLALLILPLIINELIFFNRNKQSNSSK